MAVLVFGLAAVFGVTGMAIWKGDRAERFGALAYVAAWITVVIFELVVGETFPVVPMLLLDTLVALAFLTLALRFNSLWLGAAMILQGMVLGLHATHLTGLNDPKLFGFNAYALLVNLTSLGILATFGFATGFTLSKRAKTRRRAALAAASPA